MPELFTNIIYYIKRSILKTLHFRLFIGNTERVYMAKSSCQGSKLEAYTHRPAKN